jgi:hypothetical protein
MFFEAMKAVLAVQRDHGNREVRSVHLVRDRDRVS